MNRCLGKLRHNPRFHYHPRCKKHNITHVCFADDLLLFAKGDVDSVRELYSAFQPFSYASGLRANLSKSSIYLGGVLEDVQSIILVHLTKGSLPFKYLGVPLSS